MKQSAIYFTILCLTLFISSCDKQLSAPPRNARVEGFAITNQASAQTALNGAYYRFASVTSENADATYWNTHQLWGAMLTGALGYAYGALDDESNANIRSGLTGTVWNESYLLINTANSVLDGVTKLRNEAFTGNRKKEILAEAKFLRAYANFRLLVFFGEWFKEDSPYGVLLREEPTTLSNIAKKRSSVSESYTLILSDIDEAIANAPVTNTAYYATKWAAMVLKIRVLMMRGNPADYSSVLTMADEILAAPNFQLENNPKDIFYVKGLTSSEVILAIRPQPNQEIGYYNLSGSYYPGNSGLYGASPYYQTIMQNDPRADWVIGPLTNAQDYSPGVKYFNKYVPFGGAPSQTSEVSYAMRLTEVYLLKAEAILRSGGDINDARDLIKTIKGKAGVTDFSSIDNADTHEELLIENYYEVLRSLVAEDGLEWMTLLRFPFETVKQLRPTIVNQVQLYFPVPISELQQNPLFGLQNPGYGN